MELNGGGMKIATIIFTMFVLVVVLVNLAPEHRPATTVAGQPPVIMETLDPALLQFEAMWRDEIGRRFPNAVGVLVHGNDFVEGQWVVGSHARLRRHVTPAREIVAKYRAKYPGRTLVLLACNTGHLNLDGVGRGVFYFKSSVWCVPDRALTPDMAPYAFAKIVEPNAEHDGAGVTSFIPSVIVTVAERSRTRWESDPDTNGNIFEAVEAE
jgi:hypothetical protein